MTVILTTLSVRSVSSANMLSTIKTVRGRVIQYDLRLRRGNGSVIKNDLKKIDDWLLQEALIEADCFYDQYAHTIFCGMNPKRLSPADRTMLNEYLFGQEEVMLHNSSKE